MDKYVKSYEDKKFVEQADVMIDIAMASSMKEVKAIVRDWKDALSIVDQHRRDNTVKTDESSVRA